MRAEKNILTIFDNFISDACVRFSVARKLFRDLRKFLGKTIKIFWKNPPKMHICNTIYVIVSVYQKYRIFRKDFIVSPTEISKAWSLRLLFCWPFSLVRLFFESKYFLKINKIILGAFSLDNPTFQWASLTADKLPDCDYTLLLKYDSTTPETVFKACMFDFDEENPGYCLFYGELVIDGRDNIPISTSGACSNESIDPEVTNFIVRIQSFPIQNCTYLFFEGNDIFSKRSGNFRRDFWAGRFWSSRIYHWWIGCRRFWR